MPYADYKRTIAASLARQKTERGKDDHIRYNREWRQRNKIKLAAHNAVARAIKAGKLVRLACEVCGSTNAHAHHDDYEKPLQVVWLCDRDHKERHKMLRTKL